MRNRFTLPNSSAARHRRSAGDYRRVSMRIGYGAEQHEGHSRAAIFSELVPNGARLRTVLSLVVISLLLAQSALAQTQLVASNPQMGAVIRRHDITLWLRFNKR